MLLWGLVVGITAFLSEASDFRLVDKYGGEYKGEGIGLLLYRGGLVCDDDFTDMAAEAICRDMKYGGANRWTSSTSDDDIGYYFNKLRWNYNMKLDDVNCQTPDWESCTYTIYHDCTKTEGVFLSCQGIELFTLVNQNGNEIDGEDLGLLLYHGGTVCDDFFNNTAADAICKTMNYTSAIRWTTDEDFGLLQRNYGITLDNVRCSSSQWESCTFTEWHNCEHDEDVFLSCRKTEPDSSECWDAQNRAANLSGYRGTQSTTQKGFTCQKWTSQYPHKHSYTVAKYGAKGVGDHNYCRNPAEKYNRTWCYTTNPSSINRWDWCIVPTCPYDDNSTDDLFSIVDKWGKKGANSGLLLYKGGTVCPERFYDNAAIAICSLLGYENEEEMSYWRAMDNYGWYERTLEYLYCSDDEWSSCTVSTTRECYASDDVYLQCKQEDKKLAAGYIVLIVGLVVALLVVVGGVCFVRQRRQRFRTQQTTVSQQDQTGQNNIAAAGHIQSPRVNPLAVNRDTSNENIYETRLDEPVHALGTDNLPPPQYEENAVQFGDDQIPSYEEVMANDHIYQTPK